MLDETFLQLNPKIKSSMDRILREEPKKKPAMPLPPKDAPLGEKMLAWRENASLTRKEFARKLNVSLTAVKNWETGHSTPKLTKYSEIAKVLGIDVRDMGLDSNLDFQKIGDRIKYARLLRGMSIEAFSYEFGFAIQTVKSWESHTAEVSEPSLGRISRALDIPPSFFDMKANPHQELMKKHS